MRVDNQRSSGLPGPGGQRENERWPPSAPLINSYSDVKPEPPLQSAFMSRPICLQKPNFSLFTPPPPLHRAKIINMVSAIAGSRSEDGGGGVRGGTVFAGRTPPHPLHPPTSDGLSQRDILKAALYSHTSRRNNNEPWGL